MNIDRAQIEEIVRKIVTEKLSVKKTITPDGLVAIDLPAWDVSEDDRMDTGNPTDQVYTKDFFDLKESPRLGAGLMVMKNSTFDWTLNYDEVDYVIDGTLSVIGKNGTATANAGQIILIPKGSKIKFSVPDAARFIYITYPADWENQA
ncbi:cupin domain-containing protein [Levilactobacillus angrenensis]|uniref:Ethanolamine utilization protein EutQ n=1 Tax=Levilactobacillus angrenensis TaxID=2486020 RepID=A0ABW1UDQ3_9LACO|nr:ethanolamine utilization protein EutQ [Levilactobacillus angrenensis]